MANRTKRTYSLRPETVSRVRDLATRYGTSQDALVDTAVERLDRTLREEEETSAWASAAADPDFIAEARQVAAVLDEPDRWPA
jgi:hypothetical protein